MCSQNAGNVISEPPILKISPGPPLESLSMSPPRQNQNSTPMLVLACLLNCVSYLMRVKNQQHQKSSPTGYKAMNGHLSCYQASSS